MNIPFAAPLRGLVAFLIVSTLPILTGCDDRVFPVDNNQDSTASYKIFYSLFTQDPFPQFVENRIVNQDGTDDRPFPNAGDFIPTCPPAKGYMAYMESDDFVNVVDLKTGETIREIPRKYGKAINYNSVSISPLGDKVAYSVYYDDAESQPSHKETTRAVVVDLNTGNQTLLSAGARHDSYTRFSPDGQYLTFTELDKEGDGKNGWLYVAKVDGTDTRKVADIEEIPIAGFMMLTWSPDSREIAYTDFEDENVYIAAADGSGKRSLGNGYFPNWSPDGSRLVITQIDGTVLVTPSGEREPLGISANFTQWSPDGKHLLLFEVDPNIGLNEQLASLIVYDPATKERQVLNTNSVVGYWIE